MCYLTGSRPLLLQTGGRPESSVGNRHAQIMTPTSPTRAPRAHAPTRGVISGIAAGLAACLLAALAAGCGATGPPELIHASELAEAQTFPYYRVYWAGPRFKGAPLDAADGRKNYNSEIGDSVYYGSCVTGHGVFAGGSTCTLPLQVTTVIYRRHSNQPLGPQRNLLIRGVPATVYDEGRSLELYTGQLAIDIFSDSFAGALAAAKQLRTLNAAGSSTVGLPPPVYCPSLYGPQEPALEHVMRNLPGHACQSAAAELAFAKALRAGRYSPG